MQQILSLGKVVAAGVWIWGVAAMLGVAVPFADVAPTLVLCLACVHAMEMLVFLPKLTGNGGYLKHAVGLLLFGMLHHYSARPESLGGSNT